MHEEETAMGNPRAKPNMGALIARAGLEQRELARLAGVSDSTVYDLTNPPKGRDGNTRPATAWKIARAFARHEGISEEAAFSALFTEEE